VAGPAALLPQAPIVIAATGNRSHARAFTRSS
jgi:hypothetical protein